MKPNLQVAFTWAVSESVLKLVKQKFPKQSRNRTEIFLSLSSTELSKFQDYSKISVAVKKPYSKLLGKEQRRER